MRGMRGKKATNRVACWDPGGRGGPDKTRILVTKAKSFGLEKISRIEVSGGDWTETGQRLDRDWAETGRDWAETGQRLGGDWTETGSRLDGHARGPRYHYNPSRDHSDVILLLLNSTGSTSLKKGLRILFSSTSCRHLK